jgi:hypothetical protein
LCFLKRCFGSVRPASLFLSSQENVILYINRTQIVKRYEKYPVSPKKSIHSHMLLRERAYSVNFVIPHFITTYTRYIRTLHQLCPSSTCKVYSHNITNSFTPRKSTQTCSSAKVFQQINYTVE